MNIRRYIKSSSSLLLLPFTSNLICFFFKVSSISRADHMDLLCSPPVPLPDRPLLRSRFPLSSSLHPRPSRLVLLCPPPRLTRSPRQLRQEVHLVRQCEPQLHRKPCPEPWRARAQAESVDEIHQRSRMPRVVSFKGASKGVHHSGSILKKMRGDKTK